MGRAGRRWTAGRSAVAGAAGPCPRGRRRPGRRPCPCARLGGPARWGRAAPPVSPAVGGVCLPPPSAAAGRRVDVGAEGGTAGDRGNPPATAGAAPHGSHGGGRGGATGLPLGLWPARGRPPPGRCGAGAARRDLGPVREVMCAARRVGRSRVAAHRVPPGPVSSVRHPSGGCGGGVGRWRIGIRRWTAGRRPPDGSWPAMGPCGPRRLPPGW